MIETRNSLRAEGNVIVKVPVGIDTSGPNSVKVIIFFSFYDCRFIIFILLRLFLLLYFFYVPPSVRAALETEQEEGEEEHNPFNTLMYPRFTQSEGKHELADSHLN